MTKVMCVFIFIKIKFCYLNIKILTISNIRHTNTNINLKIFLRMNFILITNQTFFFNTLRFSIAKIEETNE